jgi:hypothetical protein
VSHVLGWSHEEDQPLCCEGSYVASGQVQFFLKAFALFGAKLSGAQ